MCTYAQGSQPSRAQGTLGTRMETHAYHTWKHMLTREHTCKHMLTTHVNTCLPHMETHAYHPCKHMLTTHGNTCLPHMLTTHGNTHTCLQHMETHAYKGAQEALGAQIHIILYVYGVCMGTCVRVYVCTAYVWVYVYVYTTAHHSIAHSNIITSSHDHMIT